PWGFRLQDIRIEVHLWSAGDGALPGTGDPELQGGVLSGGRPPARNHAPRRDNRRCAGIVGVCHVPAANPPSELAPGACWLGPSHTTRSSRPARWPEAPMSSLLWT